ncbi:MAG TPA: sigma-70 family RNA polymerase sigma factor [Streptosporangiaceae bacterium]|nr:sigma-70 family RNA polymerase sigma factor [Streptosporangiaceae bacterium]
MASNEWLAAAFEEHRGHLRAVAYRLLGSITDADDAVQDAWLRLSSTDASGVENLGGWLTTIVARVSLNMLRARRRETPVGDAWPSAAESASAERGPIGSAGRPGDPEDEALLADSVGVALLVVLDSLTPAERLAFVLHDLFAIPFTEIASILGRSTEATRQLASRARRRVRGVPSPDRTDDVARQREVAAAFLAATREGDFSALVALLDADVTLTADAFIAPSGQPIVLHGLERVARGAIASSVRAEHSQLALLDGNVGIVYAPAGRLQLVLLFTVSEAKTITGITIIANPARLGCMQVAVLPD